MQAVFDNLTSILVAAVVLLILVVTQVRGTMSAMEQTINYMVVSEALHINQLLERDLENLLTRDQTEFAIADSNYSGTSGAFTCELETQNNQALQMTFPTVANPDSTMNSADPNAAQVIEVTYRLIHTPGDSLVVPVNNVQQRVPLFQLVRLVNGDTTATSHTYVTDFFIEFNRQGELGLEPVDRVTYTVTQCADNLAKVRYQMILATEGTEFATLDQRSTSRQNITRFGATVNLTNWE